MRAILREVGCIEMFDRRATEERRMADKDESPRTLDVGRAVYSPDYRSNPNLRSLEKHQRKLREAREAEIEALAQSIAEHLHIKFGYHSILLMKSEIAKVIRDFHIT